MIGAIVEEMLKIFVKVIYNETTGGIPDENRTELLKNL